MRRRRWSMHSHFHRSPSRFRRCGHPASERAPSYSATQMTNRVVSALRLRTSASALGPGTRLRTSASALGFGLPPLGFGLPPLGNSVLSRALAPQSFEKRAKPDYQVSSALTAEKEVSFSYDQTTCVIPDHQRASPARERHLPTAAPDLLVAHQHTLRRNRSAEPSTGDV
jgi:hypothetical protein